MAFIKQGRLSQDQSLNRPDNLITKISPELWESLITVAFSIFMGRIALMEDFS